MAFERNDNRGPDIELRDFGVFEVVERKSRKARNPRMGEKVVVPARLAVKFTLDLTGAAVPWAMQVGSKRRHVV